MPDEQKSAISLESTVVASKNQVSSELVDEVVIMDMKSGAYMGLNSSGARIWNLVQQPRKVSEVRDTILKEYNVEPDRCQNDVLALLRQLAAKGLLDVVATARVAVPA